jgi:SAM-dependent methyltransferase
MPETHVPLEQLTDDVERLSNAANLINFLYENFETKRSPSLSPADCLLRLKSLLEQAPANILPVISPNDTKYARGWEQHYASVGQSALQCVRLALLAARKLKVKKILDLPCGHGRVQRVLRAAFPEALIAACDPDPDAVDFCAKAFGAVPVHLPEQPGQLHLEDRFDLVWSGSLFTHLNQGAWPGYLEAFAVHLAPGGLLVFTVHGRESVDWLRSGKFDYSLADVPAILAAYDRGSFGYQAYPAHTNRDFGIAIASPAWVVDQVVKAPGLRLLNYTEKGLDNHQDVVACVRV